MPKDPNKSERFPNRPSLGLKLWGPLVPSSDNRRGLWTLWTIQTSMGLFALYKFRQYTRPLVSGTPSLNRFSSHTTGSRSKRWISLTTSIILLSQSGLEWARLKLLPWDPWYDEAHLMRDKQFFNDIVSIYYKENSKDVKNNLPLIKFTTTVENGKEETETETETEHVRAHHPEITPSEWRQSMAIIRAQAEQTNPVVKWFGPLNYKPMSFTKYVDLIEYYLSMKDIWYSNNPVIRNPISQEVYQDLCKRNQDFKSDVLNGAMLLPTTPRNNRTATIDDELAFPIRRGSKRQIVIDPTITTSPETVNLNQIWALHDPWVNLALDTALSIKFIPTSIVKDKEEEEKEE